MKSNEIIAWNLVTRVSHWLIAIPVMIDFFLDGGDFSHKTLGYLAMTITLFRIYWGGNTKDQANFSDFPLGLQDTLDYIKSLPRKSEKQFSGHNPLASWVYILMWGLVMGLGITGYMMGLDAFWGEEWLEEIHELLSSVMMFLVFLHFIGIILDSWRYKRKTWMGMVTGKKL